MHIEHIVSEDGDWAVLRVNGEEFYSGHSVPDFVWMTLLHTASGKEVSTSSKEISSEDSEDMEEGDY